MPEEPKREILKCPQCGEMGDCTVIEQVEAFRYGVPPNAAELQALIHVHRCDWIGGCGFQWTDWTAEQARERAVRNYLLRKDKILEVRLCVRDEAYNRLTCTREFPAEDVIEVCRGPQAIKDLPMFLRWLLDQFQHANLDPEFWDTGDPGVPK